MTKAQLKKDLRDALGVSFGRVKLDTLAMDKAMKVITSVTDRNGNPFSFFAFCARNTRDIYLTDAGSFIRDLEKSGMSLKMTLVQKLINSYGLTLTQEAAIVDTGNRPLPERVMNLFQSWAAVDGVMRMWTRPS